MPNQKSTQTKKLADTRQKLLDVLDHFEHSLPAQAPIRDFVHHNTLHGFENLKFPDALKSANEITGAYGYWSKEKFRETYKQGRINNDDIQHALQNNAALKAEKQIFQIGDRTFCRGDIYRVALLYPIKNISPSQLRWHRDEAHALKKFQTDVAETARKNLLQLANAYGLNSEAAALHALWASCIEILKLDTELPHPEDLMNFSPEQAEKMFASLSSKHPQADTEKSSDKQKEDQKARQQAWQTLKELVQESKQKDNKFSLNNLIKTLTGVDVQEDVISRSTSKIDPVIRQTSWQELDDLLH